MNGHNILTSIVRAFLQARYSLIFLTLSLALGLTSVLLTPREEEPQIIVPLADIFVAFPGAGSHEIEKLVTVPLERILWQIDGVEYVYSMSAQDRAVVSVRFHVGEDRERSLVKLHNQIARHMEKAPPGVTGWQVRSIEVDDVPIVNINLYSKNLDDYNLRRIGEEVLVHLAEVGNTSGIQLAGGRSREVRIEADPEKMAGFGISLLQMEKALGAADASVFAGSYTWLDQEVQVGSRSSLSSIAQLEALVIGVHNNRPVYLRDVASILDGPQEASSYVRVGFSNRVQNLEQKKASYPSVTLAVAKQKGSNAVQVARDIREKMAVIAKTVLPTDIKYTITRDSGLTADDKVHTLMSNLFFAILTVVVLLVFFLGWREALVVAVAVPISFSLALFVNYLLGYTLNRVTLFALILSLGLVVDDPITNVDNIQRHIRMGKLPPREATLAAVAEVLPPVIMSTLAIIISFAPMFFITGMMGPYMAPMAANVPLTVTFSTLCALTVVPWLSFSLLGRKKQQPEPVARQSISPDNLYTRLMTPLLESKRARLALFGGLSLLFAISVGLAGFGFVPLKMLPFDNKNEFQLVLDMPEDSSLERTDRTVRAFEHFLRQVPEVTNFVSSVGTPAPMDFNGMVRHYYLRRGRNLADIQVNLAQKDKREAQSHAIVLRLRPALEKLAASQGCELKIVESPPGPPVLSTLVAEIYGTPSSTYDELITAADKVSAIMRQERGVVDIDTSVEAMRPRLDFVLDREKAALHGVSARDVVATLKLAISGANPALIHSPKERQPLRVCLRLPRATRSSQTELEQLHLTSHNGVLVALGELGKFQVLTDERPVFHKNLRPVVYVYAEMAGRAPAEAILGLQSRLKKQDVGPNIEINWAGEGEWKITLDVFRDLGLAYGAALTGSYLLLVLQTASWGLPLLIMLAIPLTLLGIMPGFWLLNIAFSSAVGDLPNPVFFTATSMIGMIALGGIVIRNSLVLIEFIQGAVQEGTALKEAVLQSGVVRIRPILLTATTTALGAWPITLDPIFSGLAWALIFGLLASTFFTLFLVPTVYYLLYKKQVAAIKND